MNLILPPMRLIRCDCGFEASGDRDDELVKRAQAHAREVHNMDMPTELVLGLAGSARADRERP